MKNHINEEQIRKNTKTYTNQAGAFRALLGGIGTGNISLDASARLCDFEIRNHPDKKLKIPYTFFSIWSRFQGERSRALILEAAPEGTSDKALGHPSAELLGLPRFHRCEETTNYPFYKFRLEREDLPLEVILTAYTPFIPLNSTDSGIPGFQMQYEVRNVSGREALVSVCGTMYNDIGFVSYDGFDRLKRKGRPYNVQKQWEGLRGVLFANEGLEKDDVADGTMMLATTNKDVTVKHQWQTGGWWDGAEEFWQDFREDGRLNDDVSTNAAGSNIGATPWPHIVGSVAARERILPGETKTFTFYFTWNFPNRYGWWPDGHADPADTAHRKVWKNYYSSVWPDAAAVMKYFVGNKERLYRESRLFADALYSTTLDADVIESLVSAITVIRSNTCFRVEDGSFFAWEGCFDHAGSCPGTCTHVWNYAQALAFLFPELEISARRNEFLRETDRQGKMAFRGKTYLDGKTWEMLPAADGQTGTIVRVYREWMLTGDDQFLREVWEKVVLALDFSLKYWDRDGDGVMDSQQHNTYDIEFYGINSLTNSMLYAALEAGARMADYLGETERAARWRDIGARGSRKMDEILWNGEYYQQGISGEDLNRYKYQFGKGCLADQILGQELAHVCGLGYILPREHVKQAAASVFKYNFQETLENHESVQRAYAYQDEGGLILCSWPKGGRPGQPFVYSDEIWTGIEYQVAVQLIYEGMPEEAMRIVKTLRERYNGKRRSPYDELECGHHYARSISAWGLLTALSGYRFDIPHGEISFDPKISRDNFTCFYSHGREWGIYHQEKRENGQLIRETVPLYRKER